jgi:uncharacterized protein (TIGR02172 family)
MKEILSTPIAQGRTAEIFAWDDDHVFKLYFDWCPSNWVEYESRIAHAVHDAGIPAPAAGEVVEINGRRGLIYERVEGISMLQELNSRPWTLLRHARSLAELQIKIHRQSIPGLPSYKEHLHHAISTTPYLSDVLRDKYRRQLDALPDEKTLCHGDYHPGNIILTRDGPVIIDWMTACSGCRWADVARTSLLLTVGPKGAANLVSPLLLFGIRFFHRTYLNRYLGAVPDKRNELKRWAPVIAAARLNEDIAPEREALLEIVQKG